MSQFFGTPADEFGSDETIRGFRQLSDIADDKGSYWLMKEGIRSVIRRVQINQDKPLVFRAGDNIKFFGDNSGWRFVGSSGEDMFKTFPLKEGIISGFTDNTTNTLVTTTIDHNLNVDDTTRIQDSRVGEYNGLFTIVATPSPTTFEIDVPFNGVDGQCKFFQHNLFISGTAKSIFSEEITGDPTIVSGGTGYIDAETVTITGQTSGATNATAIVTVVDGIITAITLVLAGSDYTDGEIVTLTGITSLSNDATATIVVGPELTTLTMINHGLDDNISIFANFGPPPPFNDTVISNVTTDTVDIEKTFVSSQTGLADVGVKALFYQNETIAVFPPIQKIVQIWNIDGSDLPGPGGVEAITTSLLDFQGCNVRGLEGGINIINNSRMINCSGFKFTDSDFVNVVDTLFDAIFPPVRTEDYESCIRVLPSISGQQGLLNFNRNSLAAFSEFQSILSLPEQVNTNDFFTVHNNATPSPGELFSLGFVAVSENSAIVDAGGGTITIPVDQTVRYREGDEIEILESTSYNGEIGTIQVGGIVIDTSITVDIAFVAGDTEITLRDNTLISKDETDPQVSAILNQGLKDSSVIAEVFYPFDDSGFNVAISAQDTLAPITTPTYTTQLTERMTTTSAGLVTYIGEKDVRVLVNYWAINSDKKNGVGILKNGVDTGGNHPELDDSSANFKASNEIVELTKGDTLQLGGLNIESSDDITTHQGTMTISLIGTV